MLLNHPLPLTPHQISTLAAPVVEALRSIEGDSRDGAGIADRGGDVYRAALDGRFSILRLSCARAALAFTASPRVLDTLGVVRPSEVHIAG